MKSKENNLINYSNTYLKLQPSLTSFTVVTPERVINENANTGIR